MVGVFGFVLCCFFNLCQPRHCDRRMRGSASRRFLLVLGVGVVEAWGGFDFLGVGFRGGGLGRLLNFCFIFSWERVRSPVGCCRGELIFTERREGRRSQ